MPLDKTIGTVEFSEGRIWLRVWSACRVDRSSFWDRLFLDSIGWGRVQIKCHLSVPRVKNSHPWETALLNCVQFSSSKLMHYLLDFVRSKPRWQMHQWLKPFVSFMRLLNQLNAFTTEFSSTFTAVILPPVCFGLRSYHAQANTIVQQKKRKTISQTNQSESETFPLRAQYWLKHLAKSPNHFRSSRWLTSCNPNQVAQLNQFGTDH